jgi:hypothetical protein
LAELPPLEVSDPGEFRRRLLGLSAPAMPDDLATTYSVKEAATAFVADLADMRQRRTTQDPKAVWTHVGKAIRLAGVEGHREFGDFAAACVAHLGLDPEEALGTEFVKWLTAFDPRDPRGVQVQQRLTGPLLLLAVAEAQDRRKNSAQLRAAAVALKEAEGGESDA